MTDRIKYIILATILFVTPLLVYHKMIWGYFTPKHLFFQLMISLLPLIIVIGGRIRTRYNFIDVCVLIWLLFPILHTFVFGEFQYSKGYLDTNLYLFIYYLALRSLSDIKQIQKLIKWIVYAAGLISIYGILQYFNIDPLLGKGYNTYGHQVVGTLGNANSMGAFLAITLPLSIYHGVRGRSPLFIRILIPILISTGLILSFSRGAIVGLVAASLVFLIPKIRKLLHKYVNPTWKRVLIVTGSFILLGLLLVQMYNLNSDSAKGRLFIGRITVGMIKEQPVSGIGYGRYGVEYLNYQADFFADPDNSIYYDRASNMKQSDNEYLQVWAELGVTGILAFVVLMGYIISQVIRAATARRFQPNRLLLSIIGISILTPLIHSLVDNPLRVLPIQIVFYFCMAATATALETESDAYRKSFQLSDKARVILVPVTIILIVFISVNTCHKSRAYLLWQSGQETAAQGNWNDAISEYEQAHELLPGNHELMFHLGAAYSYTKQPKKALPILEEASNNFNDKNLYTVRGATYLQLKQLDRAEENFKSAISMYPNLLLPRLWLAEMYISQNKMEEAKIRLDEIISITPKNVTGQIKSIKLDALKLLNSINRK